MKIYRCSDRVGSPNRSKTIITSLTRERGIVSVSVSANLRPGGKKLQLACGWKKRKSQNSSEDNARKRRFFFPWKKKKGAFRVLGKGKATRATHLYLADQHKKKRRAFVRSMTWRKNIKSGLSEGREKNPTSLLPLSRSLGKERKKTPLLPLKKKKNRR